jgi:hypothetical protein
MNTWLHWTHDVCECDVILKLAASMHIIVALPFSVCEHINNTQDSDYNLGATNHSLCEYWTWWPDANSSFLKLDFHVAM